jgi:hypothetical protein
MGSWSATIMGGDTPFDIFGCICDEAKLETDNVLIEDLQEKEVAVLKNFLGSNLNSLFINLRTKFEKYPEDVNLIWQVISYYAINLGVILTESDKDQIILSAKNDDWARGEYGVDDNVLERRAVMQNLIKTVLNYTNSPVSLNSEGLFEALSKSPKA